MAANFETPGPNRTSLAQLNDRSREIFRRIVDSYLATGEPVGSRHISRLLPMTLSPASVRNVMQDLEDAGLVTRGEEKGDGRAARLRLTPDGKRKRDEASRRAIAGNARLLQGFTEREADIVARWLNQAGNITAPLKRSRQREKA